MDNVAETLALSVLTLVTVVLTAQAFPFDPAVVVGISFLVYVPGAAFFLRIIFNRGKDLYCECPRSRCSWR